MLKNVIFVTIAVVLSAFAAVNFAAQLESASATRASRDENVKRRSLELGIIGRIVITAIFAGVMLLLALMSHIMPLSTSVGLILAVGLIIANVYLKGNGINVLPTLFLIWIGNLISSLKNTTLGTGSIWGTIYIVLQVVCMFSIIALTVLGNYNAYRRKVRQQREDADELEEQVSTGSLWDDDEDDGTGNNNEAGDDEEDEGDGYGHWDPFFEGFWTKALKVAGIILLVVLVVLLGFWLEAKFDFFPPYNF